MASIYRRVIRVGEKSLGVTLPRQWLDSLGIGVGDVVEVTLIDDSIVIRPVTLEKGHTLGAKIPIGNSIDEAMRMIIAGYIEGFDNMTLVGDRETARRAFMRIEGKLPGSLMLEDSREAIVKVATSEATVNLIEVISSMGNIIDAMFKKLIDYLESGADSRLKEVIELDEQVDKLYFLALRTVKKLSFKDPKGAIDDVIVVKNMEHIADSLDRIANALLKHQLDEKCRGAIVDKVRQLWVYSIRAVQSYVKGNVESALRIIVDREAMMLTASEIASMDCGSQALLAGIAHEGQLMVALATDIAEATFSRHVRTSVSKIRHGQGANL